MTIHDQTEYAYKNGYEKGKLDVLSELGAKFADAFCSLEFKHDDFYWGQVRGIIQCCEIIDEIGKETEGYEEHALAKIEQNADERIKNFQAHFSTGKAQE
jgi:hypothetical protein